jgi:hypothetical protein
MSVQSGVVCVCGAGRVWQHPGLLHFNHHHHQLINIPTAGVQAFLMDYTLNRTGHKPPRGPSPRDSKNALMTEMTLTLNLTPCGMVECSIGVG